jgi:hypothetical protein
LTGQLASETDGLQTIKRINNASAARVLQYWQNDIELGSSSSALQAEQFMEMCVGGTLSANGVSITQASINECCYIYLGEALSDSQEVDHYNIVQSLQTEFSRQV